MNAGIEIGNWSCDPDQACFRDGFIVIQELDWCPSNLNGSRALTTPLTGMICHPRARTCYDRPVDQIWSFGSAHYEDMKRCAKCGKWGGLGQLKVTQGHWK